MPAIMDARARQVERFGPGEGIASPRPGDFLLIRGEWWISRVIHGGQLIRFRKAADRQYAFWNHVALVTGARGRIVEVGEHGVVARHIDKYRDAVYHYVRIDASAHQRRDAVRYAESCVGEPYARWSFVALGLSVFTGERLRLNDRGQQLCGALVARALARTNAVFDRRPVEMTPADLAKHYGVTP